jgi:hypothetical protein
LKPQSSSPLLVRQETALLRELAMLRREISTKSATDRLARLGQRSSPLPAEPTPPVAKAPTIRRQSVLGDAAD